MNNGEVYYSGYNSHYQLGYNEGGNTNTSDRNYTNRVSASDTVDWLGENIRSFNETKIVKIGSSGQGQNNSACMQFALGEDSSVWMWGHNNQLQFGGEVTLILITQLIQTQVRLTIFFLFIKRKKTC